MFSINTANRFTCIFNKVPYLTLLLMIFSIVATIAPQPAHAETNIDQETKVRNAVVQQLLIMNDKLKPKLKNSKKEQQEKKQSVEAPQNITKKMKDVDVPDDVQKAPNIAQAKKITADENVNATQVKAKSDEKTKNTTSNDKKEVVTVEVKQPQKVQKIKPHQPPKKEKDAKQTNVAKDDNIKKITLKKKIEKEPVNTKKLDSKPSFTPLVDILSEEDLQALMQDVVLSSETPSKTQNTAIKPIVESSTKDNKKASSANTDTDNAKVTSTDITKTDKKTTRLTSESIAVGRQEIGRNITPKPPSSQKTATKKIKGWIYLGKFQSNQWENQTLDIEQEIPKIGTQYAIKATMVNVRDRLPKKGKMGKVITAIKHKQTVNILQLRRLGRNRIYYWAKIEHERSKLRANN